MVSDWEYIIKCSEIVRELVIESMPTLSEREYNSIVDDGSTVLKLSQLMKNWNIWKNKL